MSFKIGDSAKAYSCSGLLSHELTGFIRAVESSFDRTINDIHFLHNGAYRGYPEACLVPAKVVLTEASIPFSYIIQQGH